MSASMRLPREVIYLILAAGAVGLFLLRSEMLWGIGYPLDDAWIHQVYARNLAESGEWAFVPGEASAASTSPLYTVLLSIGHLLGLSPFVWTSLLGILALTGAAILAAKIAEQLFPELPYAGLITGFMLVTTWHIVWAASAGMETMLFMTWSLAVIFLAFREAEAGIEHSFRRGLALGIVGGLLTLTRPEGLGLVGLVGIFMLLTFGWQRRYWAVAVAVGWFVVILPYTAWNFNLTGELLPSTADAKVAQTAPFREQSIPDRYLDMILPLTAGPQLMAAPAIGFGLWLIGKREKRWLYLVPMVWAFAHLTLFVIRLPVPFQHGRYVMPLLPPLLLYAGGGIVHLVRRYRYTATGRVLTRTLALSLLAGFPAFLWIGAGAYATGVRIIDTEMVATAEWVADNVPNDDLFAVHDIGALGYFAPRDIIDIAGLVTPEIQPIVRDHPALMTFICEQGAEWLMVLPDQRPASADDPRLTLAYESPYNFASNAQGVTGDDEPWKMRVYALNCAP